MLVVVKSNGLSMAVSLPVAALRHKALLAWPAQTLTSAAALSHLAIFLSFPP